MKMHVLAALTASLSIAGFASANLIISGELDTSDPLWMGAGSGAAGAVRYDMFSFTVDTTGLYTFDAFYPGDTGLDENLDGYIRLYESVFDPLAPALNQIAFDDDGPGGQNSSQILDVSLTAGTEYFMVTTSFTDAPTSFGQPLGEWEMSGKGDGQISVIPAPGVACLLVPSLLAAGRRRRRRA